MVSSLRVGAGGGRRLEPVGRDLLFLTNRCQSVPHYASRDFPSCFARKLSNPIPLLLVLRSIRDLARPPQTLTPIPTMPVVPPRSSICARSAEFAPRKAHLLCLPDNRSHLRALPDNGGKASPVLPGTRSELTTYSLGLSVRCCLPNLN